MEQKIIPSDISNEQYMCLHNRQPQTQIKWQKLKGLKAHLFF